MINGWHAYLFLRRLINQAASSSNCWDRREHSRVLYRESHSCPMYILVLISLLVYNNSACFIPPLLDILFAGTAFRSGAGLTEFRTHRNQTMVPGTHSHIHGCVFAHIACLRLRLRLCLRLCICLCVRLCCGHAMLVPHTCIWGGWQFS